MKEMIRPRRGEGRLRMTTAVSFKVAALAALCMCALGLSAFAQASPVSSSTHYVLQQSTMNCGGTTSVSPSTTNYSASDSLGQESVIGCSSSFDYVLQSGFWCFVGQGLVPVVLTVTKNAGNPAYPDLNWTGNNPYYYIYRSTDASAIFSGLLLSQPGQNWTDAAPPGAPLIFYNILATAPGPVAPPATE